MRAGDALAESPEAWSAGWRRKYLEVVIRVSKDILTLRSAGTGKQSSLTSEGDKGIAALGAM